MSLGFGKKRKEEHPIITNMTCKEGRRNYLITDHKQQKAEALLDTMFEIVMIRSMLKELRLQIQYLIRQTSRFA
jgi:hypothetical protein